MKTDDTSTITETGSVGDHAVQSTNLPAGDQKTTIQNTEVPAVYRPVAGAAEREILDRVEKTQQNKSAERVKGLYQVRLPRSNQKTIRAHLYWQRKLRNKSPA